MSLPQISTPYSRLLAQARSGRRLLNVHWELTHRCSERCAHCYLAVHTAEDADAAEQELTTPEALALLDDLADFGALYVTFSGGEPLLRADFFTLAQHARKRGFAVRIFSNGLAITQTAAERIAALHPLSVEISIYGAAPDTHDAITGIEGSWAAAAAALAALHGLGVHTVCKTPLFAANVRQYDALAALAHRLGAVFRPDTTITARVEGDRATRCAPLALRMSDAELAAVLRRQVQPASLGSRGPLVCNVGRSGLLIDPVGTVFPCVELRQPLGSVRQTPIATIWNDESAWEPFLRLGESLQACPACRLAAWCARCHGAAANETGNVLGPSPAHCRAARIRHQITLERKKPHQ